MDKELLPAMAIGMLVLLCFINVIYLHDSFRKLVVHSENQPAIRIHKRKWSFILFTDLIFYFIPLCVLSLAKVPSAIIISLFITFIYMGMITRMMKKDGAEFLYRSDLLKYKLINIDTNEQFIDSSGMRRLTINRIKAYYACLVKIYIFIENEDISDGCFEITINGDRFKQIGGISCGKTLVADIHRMAARMLVCTFFDIHLLTPANITYFTISSGIKDIVLNIKPVMTYSEGVSFSIEQQTK